jgi:hypothetical protein
MDVCELVGAVSATAPASPAAALRCIVEQGTQLLWAPAASSAARDGSAATNRDEGAPTAAAVPSHSSATASAERQRARKREQKRRARQRKRRQQEQERQRQQKMEGEQEPEQEEGEEGEEEEEVVAEAAAEHQRPSAVEDDEARAEAAAAVVAMVLGEPCPRAALGLAPAPAPLHRGAIEAAYRRLARRPLRPFWRALAEIYLCNVCSCQEMLRRNGRGQALRVHPDKNPHQSAGRAFQALARHREAALLQAASAAAAGGCVAAPRPRATAAAAAAARAASPPPCRLPLPSAWGQWRLGTAQNTGGYIYLIVTHPVGVQLAFTSESLGAFQHRRGNGEPKMGCEPYPWRQRNGPACSPGIRPYRESAQSCWFSPRVSAVAAGA